MTWRSLVITEPARLKLSQRAVRIQQDDRDVRVPLEDIAVVVIDQPQVLITAALLGAFADAGIAVVTTGANHHPNGVLLSYSPHSRSLKVLRQQLDLGKPQRKRLWQHIVQRKLVNQSEVLNRRGQEQPAHRLQTIAERVRSGDPDNHESQGAQVYFPALFGKGFSRRKQALHNAALDFGYAIVRATLARSLVAHGFITALGIHHRSELNPFNLADDLLEPFRPIVDEHVLTHFPLETEERELRRTDKATLVNILHHDVGQLDKTDEVGRCTVLHAAESTVISLVQRLNDGEQHLRLPRLPLSPPA